MYKGDRIYKLTKEISYVSSVRRLLRFYYTCIHVQQNMQWKYY